MQATAVTLAILIGGIVLLVLLESGLRLHRWRRAPMRLRILYASFLLNEEAIQGITEIHQRVERAGARSFDELFGLYAAASGRSRDDIEALFGFRMPRRRLNDSRFVLRNHLRWHIGLVPIPGQHLRTATITKQGTRSSGASYSGVTDGGSVKRVMVTGGSVAYGYGATSDEATIAGRLQDVLNRHDARNGWRWEVVNRGFPGATSFQELIVALQDEDATPAPDYFVSISGWNDVDQQFGYAEPNVSPLAQGYTSSLERQTLLLQFVRAGARRLLLPAALKRWVDAYRQWPGPQAIAGHGQRHAGVVRRDNDRPDMYPLW